MAVLRILVVDDNDAVRRGLSSKLQEQPEWLVVGQASDGAEAVSQHQAFLSASIQGGETISAAMVSPVTEQESLPGPPSQANQTLTAGTVAPATEKESGIDTEKEPKKNPGALKAA